MDSIIAAKTDGRLVRAPALVEKFEFVQEYNNISPALLIYFKDGSVMPIREHKFLEYVALFDKNNDFGG